MNQNPIEIFSWHEPFLAPLRDYLCELSDDMPGNAVLITPNRRPARYLAHLFAQEKKGLVLPRIITISELVAMWRAETSPAPLRVANALDQAALLFECMRMEAARDSALAKNFADMDLAAFLPWAMRLAGVLEDFFVSGRPLDNIQHLEGEVSQPAAALLASLKGIGDSFIELLRDRNWTTNGHDHLLANEHADEIPRLLRPAPGRPVIIAGFHCPGPVQGRLLRSLWRQGAKVCLHTDPALALGGRLHPAAEAHRKWLEDWQARPRLHGNVENAPVEPRYSFFAGYDLHSQLEKLKRELSEGNEKSTAIILGRAESLVPTLQNLPPANVNVSMGYPMERTPLFNLLEDLLAAGQHRKDERSYRSGDILKVARHPFLSMARLGDDKEHTLYRPLERIDYAIRKQGRYWHDDEPVEARGLSAADEEAVERARVELARLVRLFATPASLAEMAASIQQLANWLKEHCGKGWANNNPLDAEALYRMENEIVPALANNLLAEQKFPLPVLGDLTLKIVREQRIPFEADPIEGLQVMGLLESRLLHFDRVVFIDATDDVLPGAHAQDGLLPDSLRSLLGLPDNALRQAQAAYNLRRLTAGARDAHFVWQENKASSDGKKIRSRFMEQLIWDAEKEKPELVKEDQSIVERPMPLLQTCARKPRPIIRHPALSLAIDRIWQNPMAVKSLESYLACPAQYIYENALALDSNDKSADNINAQVGTIAHKLLSMIYAPAEHMERRGANDAMEFVNRAREAFAKFAREENLEEKLPVQTFIDLETSIPARFSEYRSKQPTETFIVDLEEKLEDSLLINGRPVFFKGKFDRLDQRDGRLFVIDFKTGKVPLNNADFWDNEEFFANVGKALAEGNFQALDELFAEFTENVGSVQLALYLLLLAKSKHAQKWGSPANAAWVSLTRGAEEVPMFSSNLEGPDDPRLAHCHLAIELLEAHMRLAPEFHSRDESARGCSYCEFKSLCWR